MPSEYSLAVASRSLVPVSCSEVIRVAATHRAALLAKVTRWAAALKALLCRCADGETWPGVSFGYDRRLPIPSRRGPNPPIDRPVRP